ncbi:uncharacterized protein LOC143153248 [Ptiloglossa arizonensis]|uniref:uncharacterized protein LOC143153248 n=1 Tax=Ptiloglossa arizonensis TaxID=3350558 RepID=UPI003FA04959
MQKVGKRRGRELITCQLCAGTEVRLELAFGGREVRPRDRTTKRNRQRTNDASNETYLVEGHLLRYASGLAAASGTSLPHRSCRRVSSPGAAGLVVPAAADLACPDIQGRTRAHRSREKRHSRHTKHEHPDDDDDDTRDRPVSQPSATHIRHGRNDRTPLRGSTLRNTFRSTRTRYLARLPYPSVERAAVPRIIWHSSGGHREHLRRRSKYRSGFVPALSSPTVIAARYQRTVTLRHAYIDRHDLTAPPLTVSRTVFFTYLYPPQNYPQTEERHLGFCCRGTSRMRCARRRHSCERVPPSRPDRRGFSERTRLRSRPLLGHVFFFARAAILLDRY